MDMITAEYLKKLFYHTPCNVYCKDLYGEYLWCNYTNALALGLNKPEEIQGKTDLELAWKKNANIFMKNDLFVLKSNSPQIVKEEVLLPNTSIIYTSNKIPIINENHKTIGVFGISFLEKNNLQSTMLPNLLNIQKTNKPKHSLLDSLSEKELQVAILLSQGKKAKEIAETLRVALNTVKTHRYHVFKKLKIHNVIECANIIMQSNVSPNDVLSNIMF